MPLAGHARGVVLLLEHLRHGHFLVTDADRGAWSKRAEDSETVVVAAGHQGGARCGADGFAHVPVREPDSFLRETIQVRCLVALRSERTDVRIAHVVTEDDDDVGQLLGGGRGRSTNWCAESYVCS